MWNVTTFSPTWILKDVCVELARRFLIYQSVFGFEQIFDFGDEFHGFFGFVYYALFSMYSKLSHFIYSCQLYFISFLRGCGIE